MWKAEQIFTTHDILNRVNSEELFLKTLRHARPNGDFPISEFKMRWAEHLLLFSLHILTWNYT